MSLESWKAWFVSTCELILRKLPEDQCALFYQSDILLLDDSDETMCEGWLDKSFLVQTAAAKVKIPLLWHKIFLIGDMRSRKFSRANYSHLLCFSKVIEPTIYSL
jgi:hypothetical protein